ncbi:uncharacterized protein LOC112194700 [Rosa chinensis]|uniref:uncharacterized protein LOC112194700 n=1 Tax=Rosa chinensis TaxID=74649 RepID=UPI000D08AE96|nr:uncharacterized protein LOC112194700 [Rosa chinensis]
MTSSISFFKGYTCPFASSKLALAEFRFASLSSNSLFDNDTLREFIDQYGTKIRYASPAHPQTNGQVEVVNNIIKQNFKKKLDDAKSLRAEKLPEVLWAIRTTPTEANIEFPFCMSLGIEAVISVEQEVQSDRVACFDALTN